MYALEAYYVCGKSVIYFYMYVNKHLTIKFTEKLRKILGKNIIWK